MKQLTLAECSKRKLDETYLVVYAIKNEINIKKGDSKCWTKNSTFGLDMV